MEEKRIIKFNVEKPNKEKSDQLIKELKEQFKTRKIEFDGKLKTDQYNKLVEIWKSVDNFSDYQISNFGRIKSLKYKREKILKLCKTTNGYLQIFFSKKGKKVSKRIHTLVYETFYDDKLELDECVHHKDENKKNNYYENLEKIKNHEHSHFHKLGEKNPNFKKIFSEKTKAKISQNHPNVKGENNHYHKLSYIDVCDIRKSLELKLFTPRQLSWIFDISTQHVYRIKDTNKYWNQGIKVGIT